MVIVKFVSNRVVCKGILQKTCVFIMKQFPKVTTIRDRFLGSRFQRVDNDDDDT